MKNKKVVISQNSARYKGTAEWLKDASESLDGVDVEIIIDGAINEESADLGIICHEGGKVNAKTVFYYERDARREFLFNSQLAGTTFYAQYCDTTLPASPHYGDGFVVMHAADPDFHKRNLEPQFDVVFCGRKYSDREMFLGHVGQKLDENGVSYRFEGDGKDPGEYRDILSSGRIILAPSQFHEINRRVFEAMSIGVCVTDRVHGIKNVGEEGKHFLAFTSGDEMGAVSAIMELVKNPTLMNKIDKASRKHIILNHSYKHRLKEFLAKGGVKYE